MLYKLFLVTLATLTLGQFAKLVGTNLYIFDVMVGMYVIFGFFTFVSKKEKIFVPRSLILFLIFSIIAGLTLFFVFSQNAMSDAVLALLYFVRWFFYLLSALVTYTAIKNNEFSEESVYRALALSGVMLSLLGFVQLILLPDFTVLDPLLGWDPHKNRMASTLFDPNFLGSYLVLCIALELFKVKISRKLVLILFLGLFFTYSRSAWAMLAIIIFFYGLKKSVFIIFAGILLAFSAYFAIPRIQTRITGITDPADSAHFRLISWKNTMNIIQDHPIFGVGFNNMRVSKIKYGYLNADTLESHSASGSDSSFLFVLATTGIIGFLIFLAGYFFALLDRPSYFLAAVVFSLLLGAQFINSLFFPQIMFMWLIIYALS